MTDSNGSEQPYQASTEPAASFGPTPDSKWICHRTLPSPGASTGTPSERRISRTGTPAKRWLAIVPVLHCRPSSVRLREELESGAAPVRSRNTIATLGLLDGRELVPPVASTLERHPERELIARPAALEFGKTARPELLF